MATSVDFLNFPTEIRNAIYAVIGDSADWAINDKEFRKTQRNLRLTCKQLSEEYTPVFMKEKSINFREQGSVEEFEWDVLRAEHRSINFVENIRSITLDIEADKLRFCTCEKSMHPCTSWVDPNGASNAGHLSDILHDRDLGLSPEEVIITFTVENEDKEEFHDPCEDEDGSSESDESEDEDKEAEQSDEENERSEWDMYAGSELCSCRGLADNLVCWNDSKRHVVATYTRDVGWGEAIFTITNWKPGKPRKVVADADVEEERNQKRALDDEGDEEKSRAVASKNLKGMEDLGDEGVDDEDLLTGWPGL